MEEDGEDRVVIEPREGFREALSCPCVSLAAFKCVGNCGGGKLVDQCRIFFGVAASHGHAMGSTNPCQGHVRGNDSYN